ncbi:MAG TPA: zinc metalloprotease [Chitinophagaceae bacterium]|nr:zinc metalloprotease [Chitinophagaceae bacterium]
MKKSFFVTSFLFLFVCLAEAQLSGRSTVRKQRCGTAIYYNRLIDYDTEFKRRFEANQKHNAETVLQNLQGNTRADDTIPVVVHVIGTTTMQSLVSDEVIHSQIDVLNEDYQGRNADSVRIPPAFKPLFGKSRLTFKLAGTSPLGEPTNGIVRVISNKTFDYNDFDSAKQSSADGSDAWQPLQYLNIWVVDFADSEILGVSVFPGDPRPFNYHGFTCDYRAFGRGAPHLFTEFNKGRTTTHEIGHFFNLIHIWGDDDGACFGSDFLDNPDIDDTPNQANATKGNPDPFGVGIIVTDICTPEAPGIMYQNYMDFTDDASMVMFTQGQQQLIEQTLNNAPDRSPLFTSTAYLSAPLVENDASIREIVSPRNGACTRSVTPSVLLRNSGADTLRSAVITLMLNQQTSATFNWIGKLPPYQQTEINLPGVEAIEGANSLVIYSSRPNGKSDERLANDTSSIIFHIAETLVLNSRFEEDFGGTEFRRSNGELITRIVILHGNETQPWERKAQVLPGSMTTTTQH